MTNKSRRGMIALGVFLICMAILTFLSRTIYNATLPHVTVSGVESGRLTIDGEAEYYRYLVPDSAVVDGRVYLLESDAGAWGSEAYYARAVSVNVLGSDGRYSAVEGGIKGVSQVITGWDEPFDDGAEVYVAD